MGRAGQRADHDSLHSDSPTRDWWPKRCSADSPFWPGETTHGGLFFLYGCRCCLQGRFLLRYHAFSFLISLFLSLILKTTFFNYKIKVLSRFQFFLGHWAEFMAFVFLYIIYSRRWMTEGSGKRCYPGEQTRGQRMGTEGRVRAWYWWNSSENGEPCCEAYKARLRECSVLL